MKKLLYIPEMKNIKVVSCKKGTGMALFSTYMQWKLRQVFKK